MAHLTAPSILGADFGNLQRQIKMINNSAAERIHADVLSKPCHMR